MRLIFIPFYQVHERSVQSDFLLVILKEILQKRSDLHLILMSATVDSEKFSTYFTHCPILRISGRSYPVEVSPLQPASVNSSLVPTGEDQQRGPRLRQVFPGAASLERALGAGGSVGCCPDSGGSAERHI